MRRFLLPLPLLFLAIFAAFARAQCPSGFALVQASKIMNLNNVLLPSGNFSITGIDANRKVINLSAPNGGAVTAVAVKSPVSNGAITQTICVPRSDRASVYVRYHFVVTDNGARGTHATVVEACDVPITADVFSLDSYAYPANAYANPPNQFTSGHVNGDLTVTGTVYAGTISGAVAQNANHSNTADSATSASTANSAKSASRATRADSATTATRLAGTPTDCGTQAATGINPDGTPKACLPTGGASIPGSVSQVPVSNGSGNALATPTTIDSSAEATVRPCVNPFVTGVAKSRCVQGSLTVTAGRPLSINFPDYGYSQLPAYYLHGGYNYFTGTDPQSKSNYLTDGPHSSYFNTVGQHITAAREAYCYAFGDCLLGSVDTGLVEGGFGDNADEGAHLGAKDLGEAQDVMRGQCDTGCTTGSTAIHLTGSAFTPTRLADERWIEDWNPAHTISPSSVITGGSSGGTPLPWTNLTGTVPNSTVVLSVNSYPADSTHRSAAVVHVPIVTSGQPSGFANSTTGFGTTGVAYVAGYNAGPDYYEQTNYTVIDASTIELNLRRPHPTQILIAIGGWSGYDLIPIANIQGTLSGIVNNGNVAQSNHVVYTLNNKAYFGHYAGTVDVADNAASAGESKVVNWSANISSIARSSNTVTVTLATAQALDGISVTVAGVTDSSFNGTFTFHATSSNYLTYTYSQTAANASSSGGAVSFQNGQYVLVPAAQILSAMNTVNNQIDGNVTLYPNAVQFTSGQNLVFPHDARMRIMGDGGYGGLTSIQPAPNAFGSYADGGNGCWLKGEPGVSKNCYTAKISLDHPEHYIGHGGTKDLVSSMFTTSSHDAGNGGFYKYAANFESGDYGTIRVPLNSFGHQYGACDPRAAVPILTLLYTSSLSDNFVYDPCLHRIKWGGDFYAGNDVVAPRYIEGNAVIFANHTDMMLDIAGGIIWFMDVTGSTFRSMRLDTSYINTATRYVIPGFSSSDVGFSRCGTNKVCADGAGIGAGQGDLGVRHLTASGNIDVGSGTINGGVLKQAGVPITASATTTGGVTVSGSTCTITAITNGIITAATCAP